VLWIILLLSIRNRVLRAIKRRLEGRTGWTWADASIDALAPAVTVAILASGLSLLDHILPLTARTDHIFDITLTAATILALFLFVDRSCRHLLSSAALRSPTLSGAHGLLQGGIRAS
jgi:hypothetical protein